jgi:hypothetical protein
MLGSEEINIWPIYCNQHSTQCIVCVRNGVHPHPAWHHEEFLILWWRPSCPGPYKNIFHQGHNLTAQRTYSNLVRHFFTSNYIPCPPIISTSKHFFKRKCLLYPWICKWKCFWWRNQNHQHSNFFPKISSLAFSEEVGLDSGKIDSMEK